MITVAIRALLALLAIVVCLIWAARADDLPSLKADYFAKAKAAKLANGRIVNCCGEYDAVKVRFIGHDHARGIIIAEIIDVMISMNGKVGDVLTIPVEKVTVELYSPFDEPIAFINGANEPYCLSGPSGG